MVNEGHGIIICLSGRIKSGKTLLSSELEKRGYERIVIAEFLKESVAKLYYVSLINFTDPKLKMQKLDVPWKWNRDVAHRYSKICGIPTDQLFRDGDKEVEFGTPRASLQFLGTEVLRRVNPNFHVNKAIEKLSSKSNYVCDDVRYPNELAAFQKAGAVCVFILRPSMFEISNHVSETSLRWHDFNLHLINNKSKKYLINKFTSFVDNLELEKENKKLTNLDRKTLVRLFEKHSSTTEISKVLNCSRDKIVWWAGRYLINIPDANRKYIVDNMAFSKASPEAAYLAGLLSADGCIKQSGFSRGNYVVELSSDDRELVERLKKFVKTDKPIYTRRRFNGKVGNIFVINSPYIIENLKLWNLKPRKSCHNEVPDIFIENDNLIDYWVMGLIDGDGCICRPVGGSLYIKILASKQVVEFLSRRYCNIVHHIYQEKKINNLYNLVFHGRYATEFAKRFDLSFGLQRKWSKLISSL